MATPLELSISLAFAIKPLGTTLMHPSHMLHNGVIVPFFTVNYYFHLLNVTLTNLWKKLIGVGQDWKGPIIICIALTRAPSSGELSGILCWGGTIWITVSPWPEWINHGLVGSSGLASSKRLLQLDCPPTQCGLWDKKKINCQLIVWQQIKEVKNRDTIEKKWE